MTTAQASPTAFELLAFITEVVDLAPECELVGRLDVIRLAISRYLSEEPLDADDLRSRLPPKGEQRRICVSTAIGDIEAWGTYTDADLEGCALHGLVRDLAEAVKSASIEMHLDVRELACEQWPEVLESHYRKKGLIS